MDVRRICTHTRSTADLGLGTSRKTFQVVCNQSYEEKGEPENRVSGQSWSWQVGRQTIGTRYIDDLMGVCTYLLRSNEDKTTC
jgi:hypothetical protein